IVVADPSAAGGGGAAMDPVAAAVGDAAQLLEGQVDQPAGVLALVAGPPPGWPGRYGPAGAGRGGAGLRRWSSEACAASRRGDAGPGGEAPAPHAPDAGG